MVLVPIHFGMQILRSKTGITSHHVVRSTFLGTSKPDLFTGHHQDPTSPRDKVLSGTLFCKDSRRSPPSGGIGSLSSLQHMWDVKIDTQAWQDVTQSGRRFAQHRSPHFVFGIKPYQGQLSRIPQAIRTSLLSRWGQG
jgi:hypothetical protein